MSELSEIFKDWNQGKKMKKQLNARVSIEWLKNAEIPFEILSENNWHLRVCGTIDFWPSTGKWIDIKRKRVGRGIKSLLQYLEKVKQDEDN